MCEWGNTIPTKVLIPAHLSHTGRERKAIKPVDTCIARIVKALHRGGIYTVSSCCGHGKEDGSILLADGRELVVRARKEAQQ